MHFCSGRPGAVPGYLYEPGDTASLHNYQLVRCGLLRLQSGCGCGFYSIFLSMDCSCSNPNSCNSVGLQPAEHARTLGLARRLVSSPCPVAGEENKKEGGGAIKAAEPVAFSGALGAGREGCWLACGDLI
jgi:hypothetical protein